MGERTKVLTLKAEKRGKGFCRGKRLSGNRNHSFIGTVKAGGEGRSAWNAKKVSGVFPPSTTLKVD